MNASYQAMEWGVMMVENIMCAFSGGGLRAMFFHAGVLRALVRLGLKKQISALSCVSGGSITGALFALRYNEINSLASFDHLILTPLVNLSHSKLASKLIFHKIMRLPARILTSIFELFNFSSELYASFYKHNSTALFISELDAILYGSSKLSELPAFPRLCLNTTNLNTGNRWRFTKQDFGDYKTGYSYNTECIKISEAVAASAGYPLLFPPYRLITKEYTFFRRNRAKQDIEINTAVPAAIFLSDGGIYDNLGIHALKHQLSVNERNFLVISDASSGLPALDIEYGYINACKRTVDILLEQVIRHDRQIITHNFTHNIWRGIFFRLDNSTQHYRVIDNPAGINKAQIPAIGCTEEIVKQIRDIGTGTTVFTPKQICNLLHHGETLTETLLAKWHHKAYLKILQSSDYITPNEHYCF